MIPLKKYPNFSRNATADVFDKGLNSSILESKSIKFTPGTDSFTILCEINCSDLEAGNRILSNRAGSRGFELVAPRCYPPIHVISVFIDGTHSNIGATRIVANEWHHIAVTIDKKQGANTTICSVYLNGKYDGLKVFPSNNNLNTDRLGVSANIGDWVGHQEHSFSGKISNLQIFYNCICTKDEVHEMAVWSGYFGCVQDPGYAVRIWMDTSRDFPEALINAIAAYCVGGPLK